MSGVRIPPPRPTPSGDATRKGLTFGSVRQTLCLRFLMVAVAHQVEHRIVAPEVAGSRPVSHPIQNFVYLTSMKWVAVAYWRRWLITYLPRAEALTVAVEGRDGCSSINLPLFFLHCGRLPERACRLLTRVLRSNCLRAGALRQGSIWYGFLCN